MSRCVRPSPVRAPRPGRARPSTWRGRPRSPAASSLRSRSRGCRCSPGSSSAPRGGLLAARSPALPLAIWTASLLPELVLHGRLPKGATVAGFAAWTALGLAIAVARRDRPRPSLAVAIDLPAAAMAGLVALLLVRLPACQAASYADSKVELFLFLGVLPFVVGVLVGYVRWDLLLFIAVSAGLTLAAAIYDAVLLGNGGINSPATNRLALSSCSTRSASPARWASSA